VSLVPEVSKAKNVTVSNLLHQHRMADTHTFHVRLCIIPHSLTHKYSPILLTKLMLMTKHGNVITINSP